MFHSSTSHWRSLISLQRSSYLRSVSPFKRCRAVAITMIVVMAMVVLASCGGPRGEPATDFQLTLFDGTSYTLSEQVGRNVVVNFWFPTCPPCRAEMPAFQRAWEQLQSEGTQFLGIFVPQGFDSEQDARDFVDELGLTYSFATDKGARVAQAYQVKYFPVTFFIDKSGRIFKEEISALDEDKIVSIVHEMTQG